METGTDFLNIVLNELYASAGNSLKILYHGVAF
jgi:hypothetical protein